MGLSSFFDYPTHEHETLQEAPIFLPQFLEPACAGVAVSIVAKLAHHHDVDPYSANERNEFAAVFPGFILALFTLSSPAEFTIAAIHAGKGVTP
jgi:hypothetical protein